MARDMSGSPPAGRPWPPIEAAWRGGGERRWGGGRSPHTPVGVPEPLSMGVTLAPNHKRNPVSTG